MRWLLPLMVLLGGCREQQSFDERYRETAGDIAARANAIDANLTNEAGQPPAPSPGAERTTRHSPGR